MNHRQFTLATGAVGIAGLAGCLSNDGESSSVQSADSPEDVVEEYFRTAQEVTGGQAIEAQNLFVRGQNIESGHTGAWHELEGSEYEPADELSAGDVVDIQVEDGTYVINVVWESPEGDESVVLAVDEGPDS